MLISLYLTSIGAAFLVLIAYMRLKGVPFRHIDPFRLSFAALLWPGTLIYVTFAAVMRPRRRSDPRER